MNFEGIIRASQKTLFKKLIIPGSIYRDGSYVLIPGTAPVLLVAHLDTVHREPVQTVCYDKNHNVLMSPQGIGGDDRCGVYALREVYGHSKKKPWLLFTCDEEKGCIGAGVFVDDHKAGLLPKGLSNLKFIIEIDRMGKNDAVYYDCDNEEFEKYITSKGFKTQYGSCSDISDIAPELGVAAVNLSSGYHNPHTQHEYIVMSELRNTIKKVLDIVAEADNLPKYEYVEAVHSIGGYYGGKYYGGSYYGGSYYGGKYIPLSEKYEMLIDIGYTKEELDYLKEEEGEWAVSELFKDEFVYGSDKWDDDGWYGAQYAR